MHYNKEYFSWQQSIGEVGGILELYKFRNLIKPTDKVIDFGCGGGFLLKNLNCAEKIGIEINPSARENAASLGINAYSSYSFVEDSWADVIISNHALEHAHHPLTELGNLLKKLKTGGKAIFVVPQEINYDYKEEDIDQHLYTWTPLALGNLFKLAGYKVEKVETLYYVWFPSYIKIYKYFGQKVCERFCELRGRFYNKERQIRITAVKQKN